MHSVIKCMLHKARIFTVDLVKALTLTVSWRTRCITIINSRNGFLTTPHHLHRPRRKSLEPIFSSEAGKMSSLPHNPLCRYHLLRTNLVGSDLRLSLCVSCSCRCFQLTFSGIYPAQNDIPWALRKGVGANRTTDEGLFSFLELHPWLLQPSMWHSRTA